MAADGSLARAHYSYCNGSSPFVTFERGCDLLEWKNMITNSSVWVEYQRREGRDLKPEETHRRMMSINDFNTRLKLDRPTRINQRFYQEDTNPLRA